MEYTGKIRQGYGTCLTVVCPGILVLFSTFTLRPLIPMAEDTGSNPVLSVSSSLTVATSQEAS
jgi:hypothetical protein